MASGLGSVTALPNMAAERESMLINGCWPVVLLASLGASAVHGQEFTPATFSTGEFSLRNTLNVPLVRPPGGYDVSLTCQMIVETDGSTTNPHCLVDERYRDFQWEVIRAVSGAMMVPATVDGEPVRVLMNFMAGYRCLEACGTLLISNHARYVQDYGFEYSSPQPILEGDTWYEGYDEKLAWLTGGLQAQEVNGIRYLISTRVDRSGRSSRRRVSQRTSGYWTAATRAARSLDNVRYIPGFYEQKPIEMTLYEYWLDPSARPPETITLPVRVHMLSSIFVDSIDSTLTDAEVRRFFEGVNAHWRPATIEWKIESIVRVEAERELGYRRIVRSEFELEDWELTRVLTEVCPREQWLEDGWNVCIVHEFPYVAAYLGEGLIMVGERDFRQKRVQPFALSREFGESLGVWDTPTCTARFLVGVEGPDGTIEGTCATTQFSERQINTSRRQAEKVVPYDPSRQVQIRMPAPEGIAHSPAR